MKRLFTLAEISTPHHADKTPPLELPVNRPGLALDSLQRYHVDVGIVNECNRAFLNVVEDEPGWAAAMPWPNNVVPTLLGNGFVWDEKTTRDRWPRTKVPVQIDTGTGDRMVYMPIFPFRPEGQKVTVPIMNVHAPRKKDDPDGNLRVHEKAAKRAALVQKVSKRFVVAGDSNNVEALRFYRERGFRTWHEPKGVLFFAWAGVHLQNFQTVSKGVDGVWSDHPMLLVDVMERG